MEIYLLKSVTCLGIFYAFYKLFLERENMHIIKRFYLLGAVLASFLIPLITFTQYIEAKSTHVSVITSEFITEIPVEIEVAPNYWAAVLWSIYGLGLLFFSLKFGRNLYSMIQKIRKNPFYKSDNIFHVLLKTPTTPHTFFSYIFLNKRKFEAQEIPEEVMLHEQAHAKEFHSMDVILMELLQIVFWFNPFLYLFKHSVKLNHEFLADRAVLNNGVETANYQNILLAFSSNANAPELANSINYSFIKKRFTVMKTSTSKQAIWLRSLILLPMLAVLIYGFSTTQTKIKDEAFDATEIKDKKATPQEVAQYNALASKWNEDFARENTKRIISLEDLNVLESVYRKMSRTQKADAEPFPNCAPPPPPPIPADASEKQIAAYEKTIENYEKWYNQRVSKVSSADEKVKMTNTIVTNKSQFVKATPAQIKEYNQLAKKYNNMPQDNMRINGKEITRMRYLYDLMTLDQRKNAEPYPNIPPPPPPPDAPPVPNAEDAPPPIEVIKGVNDGDPNIPPPPPPPPSPKVAPTPKIDHNNRTLSLNSDINPVIGQTMAITIDPVVIPDYNIAVNPVIKTDIKTNYEIKVKPAIALNYDFKIKPSAETAPVTPNVLDHIIEMAKKGATFYYEGSKVSSDKAIELVKKDRSLNVQTRKYHSNAPTVHLSKSPIKFKETKS